jgi:hypothetical protein
MAKTVTVGLVWVAAEKCDGPAGDVDGMSLIGRGHSSVQLPFAVKQVAQCPRFIGAGRAPPGQ